MDFDSKRGLTFLLSLAAVPMAGCPASDDTTTNATTEGTDPSTETSNSTTNPSTSATTSADTSATTTTAGMTVGMTTESSSSTEGETDGSTESSGSSGSTSGEPEDSSSSGTTGIEVNPVCGSYAAHYVECYPKYAMYEMYIAEGCTYGLTYYSSYSMACGMAYEELLTCLTTADCADIMAETACADERAATEMAGCPTGKGSTTGVGTGVESGNDEG